MMFAILRKRKGDRSGASAAEYELMVAVIGVAMVTGMGTLGEFFAGRMEDVTTAAAAE